MKRKELVKRLFQGEALSFVYVIYNSVDNLKRVRTYLMLTDSNNMLYKLEEEGLYSIELIERLKREGYTEFNESKILRK